MKIRVLGCGFYGAHLAKDVTATVCRDCVA